MRHLPADKYNVAWFKLAEFVVRGEKERAMGMYRLLMHSINDRALALQLEGDLLLSFHDENASLRYRAAARAYREEQRTSEAIAVYEHLVSCKASTPEDLQELLELYDRIGFHQRLAFHLETIAHQLIAAQHTKEAFELIDKYHDRLHDRELGTLYHTLLTMITTKDTSSLVTESTLTTCLNALISTSAEGALQAFLTSLEATNPALHQSALQALGSAS